MIQMKALKVGTVVTANSVIVHVDPDNKLEQGRYSHPLVDEETARLLKRDGLAEESDETADDAGDEKADDTLRGLYAAAERVGENSKAEKSVDPTTALSTRDAIAFNPEQGVRDGAGPAEGEPGDDADAPPAPARQAAAKPAAKAAATS